MAVVQGTASGAVWAHGLQAALLSTAAAAAMHGAPPGLLWVRGQPLAHCAVWMAGALHPRHQLLPLLLEWWW